MQWLSPRHGRGFVAPRALSSLGRRHVSNPPPPKWFEPLRQEMLNRDLGSTVALLNPRDNETLAVTLEPFIRNSFFPSEAGVPVGNFIFPLGSHLVHFYDVVPTNALLPDGTDKRHSPGGKFKRRLWAGGSMRLDMDKYYSAVRGWASFQRIHAHERIKEVELRGQGASKKLFVTIERRFGAVADLADCGGSASDALAGQTGRGDEWGAASLVEERTLVFLKQRPDETEKLAYGVVKFAKCTPLGEPHFSRSLTPSPALLFRYSALTFNAHAIHLDPEYARQVEGHPGLLVHGPLSLTFMLALVQAHLEKLPGPRQAIQSIEYRNLAPLYSGIPLRVCAKEKKRPRTKKSRTYDVWIEVKGEMGGMAVKGTIRTSLVPRSADAPTSEGSVSDKPRAVLAAQLNASDAQPESRKTPTKSTPSSHAMEKEAPSDNTSPTLFRHVNSTKRTFWRSILAPPPRSRNALAPLRSRYVLHPLKSKVSRPSSKRSIGGSSLVRRVTSSLSVRPRVQRSPTASPTRHFFFVSPTASPTASPTHPHFPISPSYQRPSRSPARLQPLCHRHLVSPASQDPTLADT
ncbi:hypothetical protein EJ04DRAFT_503224 [Polyplosphaeria fusca]|uniref:MaoC-like domain-containing protein n=1 Tax=Polyplosphaeria fusca TaxID=682080 RepID=A0A9P4QM81_9PLEO|nr:hypothetical protein EJ04DRAFT_503224 [Polyplosphaeria fusca]